MLPFWTQNENVARYACNVVNETFLKISTHCVSLNFTASFILLYGFKVSSRGDLHPSLVVCMTAVTLIELRPSE